MTVMVSDDPAIISQPTASGHLLLTALTQQKLQLICHANESFEESHPHTAKPCDATEATCR